MRSGLRLPGGAVTAPAEVAVLDSGSSISSLRIIVGEGKKRQLRLMCEAVGYPVQELRRVRVGSIELGNLAPGRWRHLMKSEVESMNAYRGPGPHRDPVQSADCD